MREGEICKGGSGKREEERGGEKGGERKREKTRDVGGIGRERE